ncbi:MAG: glycosyltransferase family 39 protein [Hyphomonadaceae bacterium]|nr:glycosyltransferase family 39 protein [Hyphomonadaceae bacterium]
MGALDGAAALGVLFALALIARVIAALVYADITPGVEIWEYGLQGLCAAQTGGDLCLRDPDGAAYATALMPPLTSYLWLGLFTVFGIGPEALSAYVLINVLVGAACAPLLYVLARELKLEPPAALIAGLIIALYPTFVFVAATYHATNYTVAFTLGFAILLMRAMKSLHWRAALAAGLMGGLSVLTRNELLLCVLGGGALLLWAGRRNLMSGVRAAAALGLALALVMTPWIARNYVTFDRFIPIGAQAGYNLWIGFGPHARGSGNQLDNDAVSRAAAAAVREGVRRGDAPGDRYEPRVQQAYLDDALPAIEQGGVGRLIVLTAEKFAVLWVFDWTDPITRHPAYWLPWLAVHGLALFGLFALWRGRAPPIDWNGALMIVLFLGVFTLAYSISSVFARYRMHMEPFIFVFSAIGASALLARWTPINRDAAPLRT